MNHTTLDTTKIPQTEEIATIPNVDIARAAHKLWNDMIEKYEGKTSKEHLTKKILIPLEAVLHHFDPWSEICTYFIKDKGNLGIVPFTPFAEQKMLFDVIWQLYCAGVPARILILKARQMGFSTMVEALNYWFTKHYPFTSATIISHESKSTDVLFGMFTTFARRDTNRLIPYEGEFKTRHYRESRAVGDKGLKFIDAPGMKPNIEGSVSLFTGVNPDATRSTNTQFLHASEFAYYRNQTAALAALNSTIGTKTPGTVGIIESTAQSSTDTFHNLWYGDDKLWTRLFFPWWKDPRYTSFVADSDMAMMERSLKKYEREWVEEFGLTMGQVLWFRETLQANGGDENITFQEYPARPEDAFRSAKSKVFSFGVLSRLKDSVVLPVGRYDVVGDKLEPAEYGDFYLYKEVDKKASYVIGADAAKGIVVGEDSKGQVTDASVAQVLLRQENKKCEQVAVYHGKPETPAFARVLDVIGSMFNIALINVESNGPGEQVLTSLYRFRGYPALQRRLSSKIKTKRDVTKAPPTRELGFLTTEPSRIWLIDTAKNYINNNMVKIVDNETYLQIDALIRNNNGKVEASHGYHDDAFMALAFALLALDNTLPSRPGQRTPRSRFIDHGDEGRQFYRDDPEEETETIVRDRWGGKVIL